MFETTTAVLCMCAAVPTAAVIVSRIMSPRGTRREAEKTPEVKEPLITEAGDESSGDEMSEKLADAFSSNSYHFASAATAASKSQTTVYIDPELGTVLIEEDDDDALELSGQGWDEWYAKHQTEFQQRQQALKEQQRMARRRAKQTLERRRLYDEVFSVYPRELTPSYLSYWLEGNGIDVAQDRTTSNNTPKTSQAFNAVMVALESVTNPENSELNEAQQQALLELLEQLKIYLRCHEVVNQSHVIYSCDHLRIEQQLAHAFLQTVRPLLAYLPDKARASLKNPVEQLIDSFGQYLGQQEGDLYRAIFSSRLFSVGADSDDEAKKPHEEEKPRCTIS